MVLGGGAFGRGLSHEGGALMNGIGVLIKETTQRPLTPSAKRKRALPITRWHPDFQPLEL